MPYQLLLIPLFIIWVALIFYVTMAFFMSRLEKRFNKPMPSQVMIVLGARVKESGELSRTLARRTALAAELYQKGYAPLIVVSGGKGSDEPLSEAEAMRDEMLKCNVPDSAIIMEDKSKNTWENLLYTADSLAKKNMLQISENSMGQKEVSLLIVTSAYHLPRAVYIAYQQGWTHISGAGAGSPFHLMLLNRGKEALSWIKHLIYRGTMSGSPKKQL